MEVLGGILLGILVYVAVFVVCQVVATYLVRGHYAPNWVKKGREDRIGGYNRFVSPAPWIQKAYDKGYYEEENE